MIAVKGNKEIKILDIQKKEYLEKGYKILDKDLKVIANPSSKEEQTSKLQAENEKLKGEAKPEKKDDKNDK